MTLSIRPKLLELIPLVLGPTMALFVWLAPLDMAPAAQQCAGIITWVALWWLSPLIPLHVTGLIGIVLAHFFALASWKDLIAPFADPIIFLFFGGFVLARAVEYHQVDRLMVQKTMRLKGIAGNAQALFLALVVLTTLMSAFLSNTATTALVLPIGLEILRRHAPDMKQQGKLLLLLAAAASIGGTITPIGSPPNMIALGLMEKMLGSRPDFLTWVIHMAPIALTVLAGMIWLYRSEWRALPRTGGEVATEVTPSNEQRFVLLILICTAMLWFFPGLLPVMGLPTLGVYAQKLFPESVVAVVAMMVLLLWPTKQGGLLPWREAQKIDWGVLLLFGAGLSIGELAFTSGLAGVLGARLEALAGVTPAVLLVIAVASTILFTEIASNTATANLIIPVLLASASFAATPERTVYAIVAASNLAFMLPVGTPPNAIVYSCGVFSLGSMIRKGIFANGLSIAVILFYVLLFY